MRNTIAHALLAVFVVTLATSNMLLADKLIDVQSQVPVLAARLSAAQSLASVQTPIPVRLHKLQPDYGPIGTVVTIKGSGFTPTNNTILFEYHKIKAGSFDGQTLTFIVPATVQTPCTSEGACPTSDWQAVVPRKYTVSVTNANGKSNPLDFIVTPTPSTKVKIKSLRPMSGKIGTVVTVVGSGFAKTGNTVQFGYHRISGIQSNGTSLRFIVPTFMRVPCVTPDKCPGVPVTSVSPGEYNVSVTTPSGTSNSIAFKVR